MHLRVKCVEKRAKWQYLALVTLLHPCNSVILYKLYCLFKHHKTNLFPLHGSYIILLFWYFGNLCIQLDASSYQLSLCMYSLVIYICICVQYILNLVQYYFRVMRSLCVLKLILEHLSIFSLAFYHLLFQLELSSFYFYYVSQNF